MTKSEKSDFLKQIKNWLPNFSGKGRPGNKIGTPSLGSGMVIPIDCLLIGLVIDVLLLSLSDAVATAVDVETWLRVAVLL